MTNDPLTEFRFWAQIATDSERTVLCSPDLESRIKGWVDARGLGGLIKVQATPICPDDTIWVVDHNALAASTNRALSEALRQPMHLVPPADWRWRYRMGGLGMINNSGADSGADSGKQATQSYPINPDSETG